MAAPTNLVQLRSRREQVIEMLGERYADDTLDVDEYERRVEQAHRAMTLPELDALVVDLAAGPAATPETALAPRPDRSIQISEDVPDSKVLVAIFGGVERRGAWTVPRRLRAFAMFGGAEIDLREARLGPGITEVHVYALFGGADVIVSPDVRVEVDGVGILGGFGDDTSRPAHADPDMPVVRITGVAMFGGVDVNQRFPGESKREAKKRRRQERKALEQKRRKQLESGS